MTKFIKIVLKVALLGVFLGCNQDNMGGDFEASGVVYGGVSRQCYPNA